MVRNAKLLKRWANPSGCQMRNVHVCDTSCDSKCGRLPTRKL